MRYQKTFDHSKSLTKQQFKDECNINKIMERFQRTGAIDHYARNAPQYGDATSVELADAQNIIANANTMFEELPAKIRQKFENNPGKFLDFVQDEKNLEEMQELGLAPQPHIPVKKGGAKATQSESASAPTEQEANAEDKDDG